jgi:hypothetical protein
MNRKQALGYISFVIDDALGEHPITELLPNARLVGWQCGFEPFFVAVQSYLPDTRIDDDEAEELATDYLQERRWFGDAEPTAPDYVI